MKGYPDDVILTRSLRSISNFCHILMTVFALTQHMHMEQPEIDRANKDKKNQIFPKVGAA